MNGSLGLHPHDPIFDEYFKRGCAVSAAVFCTPFSILAENSALYRDGVKLDFIRIPLAFNDCDKIGFAFAIADDGIVPVDQYAAPASTRERILSTGQLL